MLRLNPIRSLGAREALLLLRRPVPQLKAWRSFSVDRPQTQQPVDPSPLLPRIWTVPNILTFTRIGTTPVLGYLMGLGHLTAALALFVLSSLTDWADGYIARKYNLRSQIGSIIDPFADKFLMATCTAALAYTGAMPLPVASIIFGRDLLLSGLSFYVRYHSLPPPFTVRRFFDISGVPTHTVQPSTLGKLNTALQMLYIGSLVMRPVWESFLSSQLLDNGFWWAAALVSFTTVTSGTGYIFGRNFTRIRK